MQLASLVSVMIVSSKVKWMHDTARTTPPASDVTLPGRRLEECGSQFLTGNIPEPCSQRKVVQRVPEPVCEVKHASELMEEGLCV